MVATRKTSKLGTMGPAFSMTLFLAGVRVTQARVRVRVDSVRGETKASFFERVLNVGCLFVLKKCHG